MAPEVRLSGPENEPIGIVSLAEALRMAGDLDVDLVEIAATANPPVCRLMDYGKFKYQEQKKAAEAKAKQKVIEVKEIKFRPGNLLLGFRFRCLLLLLVLELAVVHQSAHRRIGRGGNFNQIDVQITGHAQGFCQADDSNGLIFRAGQSDFRGHDFPVQAVFAFLALAAIAKFSSDGENPSSTRSLE